MYNPGQEISSLDFGAIIGGSLNAVVTAQGQSANTTVDFIKAVGFEKKILKNEDGTTTESDVPINVAFSYDKEVAPAQYVSQRTWTVKVIDGGNGYTGTKENYHLSAAGNEIEIKNINIENGAIKKIDIGNLPESVSLEENTVAELAYDGERGTSFAEAELVLVSATTYESVPAVVQKMQIQVPMLTMVPIPFIKIEYADIDFNVKINSVSNTNSSSVTNSKVDTSVKSGFFVKASLNASVSNQKSTSSSEEVKKDYSLNIRVHAVQDDMPAGVSRILDMLEETITTRPAAAPKEATALKEETESKEKVS